MLKLSFPLIETLQLLNELEWELIVAKMSFHLGVEVSQLIMQLEWEWEELWCGPPKPLCQGRKVKQRKLANQADGEGAKLGSLQQRPLPKASDTYWWPEALSEKGQEPSGLQGKKFFIKAYFQVNWGCPTISENWCMRVSENLVFSKFSKWNYIYINFIYLYIHI